MKTACIDAIDAWYAEETYYNYDTYSQKAGYGGQMIGHFTQLVWAATRKFGCGVAPCRSNGRPFVIVVCQFYEAGRYYRQVEESCSMSMSHTLSVSLVRPPNHTYPLLVLTVTFSILLQVIMLVMKRTMYSLGMGLLLPRYKDHHLDHP
jgi:hypothetical protein